jgi:hypothetical protein
LGYSVLAPLEDFAGYDLVAERGGKFIRIQVKTSEKRDRIAQKKSLGQPAGAPKRVKPLRRKP